MGIRANHTINFIRNITFEYICLTYTCTCTCMSTRFTMSRTTFINRTTTHRVGLWTVINHTPSHNYGLWECSIIITNRNIQTFLICLSRTQTLVHHPGWWLPPIYWHHLANIGIWLQFTNNRKKKKEKGTKIKHKNRERKEWKRIASKSWSIINILDCNSAWYSLPG